MNNQLALTQEQIEKRLDALKDPVSGKGLFTSGRISGLLVREDGKVSFTIEAPAHAAARYVALREKAEAAAKSAPGVVSVTAVLTAHGRRRPASVGKAIIAVASAKGGVGKSTVAVNLACAFASLGMKTGLLDLDVYGPSAPTLLGAAGRKPQMNPDKSLNPLEAHGLKTMSVGFLVDPSQAMIWRGAMATSAVRQMLDEVAWGDLDVLLLDLPPGTGDADAGAAHAAGGAIIVSTPQEMALAECGAALRCLKRLTRRSSA